MRGGRRPRPRGPSALSETAAFLLLDVAGVACALARGSVREVLPLPDLHPPPASGGPLAGFLNLGGVPVPVVDLARLLGLQGAPPLSDASLSDASLADPSPADDPYRHILLDGEGRTGFLVDRVEDLVCVEISAIRPVSPERTLNGCVVSEIARGDILVHVLSLPHLLTAEERTRLAALTDAAAARLAALPVA